MPPFKNGTKTRKYGASDNSLPPLGNISLDPGSLPAQEQDLVHGKVKRDIYGDLYYQQTGTIFYTLNGNRIDRTTQNVSQVIQGNHIYSLVKNLSQTIQGNQFFSITGNTTEFYVGKVDRTYQMNTTEKHPESWFQKFEKIFQMKNMNYSFGVSKLDAYMIVLGLSGSKISVDGIKVDVLGLNVKRGPIDFDITEFKAKVRTTVGKVLCTGLLIGLLTLGTPFKPNALPRPTPITPFD
jgi:hypothetical protein